MTITLKPEHERVKHGLDYLEQRGRRADARLFDRVLARVPERAPVPGDELPGPQHRRKARRKAKMRRPSRAARR